MNKRELERLVQAMMDDTLSEGELEELQAELRASPEARAHYRQSMEIEILLGEAMGQQPRPQARAALGTDNFIRRRGRRAMIKALLAAAAVIFISGAVLWRFMIPGQPATLVDFRVAPNSAFTLTHAGDGPEPMGNVLNAGSRIVIEHGVVELELPHQVRAVVEAPTAITLIDARTLKLDYGRGFFEVSSEEGRGFTVVTAQQRIVDLGTAFGIDLQPDRDELELHVFDGRVRVDSPAGEMGELVAAPRSFLLAGTWVRENPNGPPAAFRRELPAKVETVLHEDFESGLVGGRKYSLAADPTIIRDLAGNRFAGIEDGGTWTFSTRMVVTEAASYHDLGGEPSPGHITTQRSLGETVDLINLADGADTGINFRIEGANGIDLRDAGETKPPTAGTPAAELFLASGIDLDDGFVRDSEHKSPGPALFRFDGLKPGLRYDLALYGDRSGTSADGRERFTLKGAEGASNRSSTGIISPYVTELETRPNFAVGQVIRWAGIDPGPDGTVSIEIDPSVSAAENIAYLSAIRLAAATIDGIPVNFDGVPFDDSSYSDGDGLPDSFELAHTDPPSANALDPGDDLENGGSGDGLTNLQEFQYETDPHNPDTDGDGVPDAAELAAGTDPTAPPSLDEPESMPAPGRDITPPVAVFQYPADGTSNAMPGDRLTLTFNEPIELGTGRIFLRNVTNWSETEIAVGGPRTIVDGRVLTIIPPAELADGEIQLGRIAGWECGNWPGVFNPAGTGKCYDSEMLGDDEGGTIGSMRGPIMATFGECRPGVVIRRKFGEILEDSTYTVSAAIGVRGSQSGEPKPFAGYRIRLTSGDSVLAELSDETPPGLPNSVTSVGFSWDSSALPEGVHPGDPLAIEIRPAKTSDDQPHYLEIDNVRITVIES